MCQDRRQHAVGDPQTVPFDQPLDGEGHRDEQYGDARRQPGKADQQRRGASLVPLSMSCSRPAVVPCAKLAMTSTRPMPSTPSTRPEQVRGAVHAGGEERLVALDLDAVGARRTVSSRSPGTPGCGTRPVCGLLVLGASRASRAFRVLQGRGVLRVLRVVRGRALRSACRPPRTPLSAAPPSGGVEPGRSAPAGRPAEASPAAAGRAPVEVLATLPLSGCRLVLIPYHSSPPGRWWHERTGDGGTRGRSRDVRDMCSRADPGARGG